LIEINFESNPPPPPPKQQQQQQKPECNILIVELSGRRKEKERKGGK